MRTFIAFALAALVAAATCSCQARADAQEPTWPGLRADGSILLTNGWTLHPHGRQSRLPSDLPVRAAVHPGGRWLAVQHAGYRDHVVAIVDTRAKDGDPVVSTIPLGKTWSGMAWSADGDRLYVSGGVRDVVRVFEFDAERGAVKKAKPLTVGAGDVLDLVAGMCATEDGRLWVCLQRSDRVVALDPASGETREVACPDESYPFECVAAPDGKTVFVSLWGKAQVWAIDAESLAVKGKVAVGAHPCEMVIAPGGARLFVANANENTVSVVDLARLSVEETISSALYPNAPPGSTPNSIALSKDGKTLLIANADNNDCAVFDASEPGAAKSLGFVPLGWYPTSIRFAGDGSVWVANGKGSAGSRANPNGPTPKPGHPRDLESYTGSMFTGSLSDFAFPDEKELGELSAEAYRASPLQADASVVGVAARPDGSPIPAKPGDATPIEHVVYVIKENRTYDQVLGDVKAGNGDVNLCLFPEEVTPNHHAIADTFVLLDNFYVESEVSADGHEWTMGAYATDFVERSWPVSYGGKDKAKLEGGKRASLGYPAEGRHEIAFPEHGYLFDLAKAAGVSFRSYGEFIANGKTPDDPGKAAYPTLEGHFDPHFRSFDLDYRDQDRADRFLAELQRFEKEGSMPQLIVLRLPNDHTAGTGVGKLTPRAYVADNDLALGRVIEGLSKSSFWKSTTVFVVEDDAQNGPDHVDAHRTVALLAGPYVRRGAKVSTMYSTCSMLRTIELILGLQPMTQFDAAARPMFDCFVPKPDTTSFEHRPAQWDLDERNPKTAFGAKLSATFDLAMEDAADDLQLNEVIWRSVKGPDSPMPAPRRAAFVRIGDSD